MSGFLRPAHQGCILLLGLSRTGTKELGGWGEGKGQSQGSFPRMDGGPESGAERLPFPPSLPRDRQMDRQ